VGGDYFDYLTMADGRTLLLVADVSGKGLPSALVVSSLQARVQALAEVQTDVVKLVMRLNNSLKVSIPDNKFVTAFFAAMDSETGTAEYTNAGHNPPFLVRASGEVERLTAGGPVLGILKDIDFALASVRLHPGDLLVMYSDGVSEACNAAGVEFGEDTVARVAAANIGRSAEEVLLAISRELKDFLGECAPNDDITLVVARKL
jgi:sigma-B regulation protein RsbU (phosphoserine phosphatase)